MTTSIEKAVNWRNTAKTPDYNKAAKNLGNTYVQGVSAENSRAGQIAKALGSVTGAVDKYAQVQAKQKAEEQRKATALERDEAKIEALSVAAKFNEAQKKVN